MKLVSTILMDGVEWNGCVTKRPGVMDGFTLWFGSTVKDYILFGSILKYYIKIVSFEAKEYN